MKRPYRTADVLAWAVGDVRDGSTVVRRESFVGWSERHHGHRVDRTEAIDPRRTLVLVVCHPCREIYVLDECRPADRTVDAPTAPAAPQGPAPAPPRSRRT